MRPSEAASVPAGGATRVDPLIGRAASVRPYERNADDPMYRPLRIYAVDPGASTLEGGVALVQVPFEPLQAGPRGALFAVDDATWAPALLDDPAVLIQAGYAPSPGDPRFHKQQVYAVASLVYAAFRRALGRTIAWGHEADTDPDGRLRLRLCPHGDGREEMRNAYYDRSIGQVRFGSYCADRERVEGRNLPGGRVFTCLSHDIAVHEVTHALLDGLRSRFMLPTGPDVLAFHEGFADLVAVFQHFTYRPLVEEALRRSRGSLTCADLLTGVARQFGHTTGLGQPLRTALPLREDGALRVERYDAGAEPHALGAVLLAAVFEAFTSVYHRKTERYLRLASGGSGRLADGEIPADLRALLADEACQLAGQFLSVCIRAVDYCPPVDLELGEFLRAVLTADRELVPDDPWGYREAWIDAFARRGIYPPGVDFLCESSLVWQPPERPLPRIVRLGFSELKFNGDPGNSASPRELHAQATELARVIDLHRDQFGLLPTGSGAEAPCVHSVRSARRVGPDGQILFDLVAEVTQTVLVDGLQFVGGATVILDPHGDVRYVIGKGLGGRARLARQREFVAGRGARFWRGESGSWRPRQQELFRLLHES